MSKNQVVTPDSHALAIAFDGDRKPACLLLSVDAISEGGELAITANQVSLRGTDLVFGGPKGELILLNISQMCQDAAQAKLPVVIIDPNNERENKIEFSLVLTTTQNDESQP